MPILIDLMLQNTSTTILQINWSNLLELGERQMDVWFPTKYIYRQVFGVIENVKQVMILLSCSARLNGSCNLESQKEFQCSQ